MLSRVAESLYWMSRYLERAENVARFISVNLHLSLDMQLDPRGQWQPLVVTSGDEELFATRYGAHTAKSVLEFLTFDTENANSILSCLRAARENARSVRERISSEMWEHINRTYLMVRDGGGLVAALENTEDFYERIRVAGQRKTVPELLPAVRHLSNIALDQLHRSPMVQRR